jgi:SAM-dependent methyltransferase
MAAEETSIAEVSACVVCGDDIDPIADLAMRIDGFDLVRCGGCGLLTRASLPDERELREIYAPEYFADSAGGSVDGYADYLADSNRHREAARRRLALLDRATASKGRLLDVGCAAGFFVGEAITDGWDAEGIDIAESMIEWGRSQLGLPVRIGSLSSVDEEHAFTAVTMWDYIEHSLDPLDDVRRCSELLRPEGVVAISTGDAGSLAARLSGSRWHLLTPRHHNFFFSTATLDRLLARCGLETVWAGHPGSRYSVAHLAYKLDRLARTRATRALATRLSGSRVGAFALPVNLFDIVTVIARKRAR